MIFMGDRNWYIKGDTNWYRLLAPIVVSAQITAITITVAALVLINAQQGYQGSVWYVFYTQGLVYTYSILFMIFWFEANFRLSKKTLAFLGIKSNMG